MRSVRLPDPRFRRALAAVATLFVLAATLAPPSAAGGPTVLPDWALHALGFGVLALAYAVALEGRSPSFVLGAAFCLAVAVGGAVELLQPLVGRTAALGDFLADAAGAALVLGWYRMGHRVVRWRE